jgi:hypothetical protein
MTQKVLKLLYLNQELGETGLTPNGAIVNIGGVSGSQFTIGGKGVVLADGTTTGPMGTSVITLQHAYDSSETGELKLDSNKNLALVGANTTGIKIRGANGAVNIDSHLTINDVVITGLINGSINIQKFYTDFNEHIGEGEGGTHPANQITLNTAPFMLLTSSDVQSAISEIDQYLNTNVSLTSFVHEELVGNTEWLIEHGRNSTSPVINVYDELGAIIVPNDIEIIDENTIKVTFQTVQFGKAVILFV